MKKLLALLLALVMCLSLFACSDQSSSRDDDDDDDKGSKKPDSSQSSNNEAVGSWIQASSSKDAPFTITVDNDGTCKFGSGESYTWKKKANKNSDTDSLNLLLKEDGETVYSIWLYKQDTGGYILNLSSVDEDDNETYLASYSTQNIKPDFEALLQIMGPWYTPRDEDTQTTVTLNEDGTCSINNETLNWTATYYDNDSCSISLSVYNSEALLYYISAERYDSGIFSMYVNATENGDGFSLYQNPMIEILLDYWNSFSYDNLYPSFYFYQDDCSVDGQDYLWSVISSEENKLVVSISEEGSAEAKYEATLTMEGEYPQISLLDRATGENWLYYSDDYGYDNANPEALYQLAIRNLGVLEEGDSFYVEELDNWIRNNEGYTYVYNMFLSLGDYKDCAEYLARYSIYPNMLTGVDVEYTDNLGNKDDGYLSRYSYDNNGKVIYASGSDIREQLCISSSYAYGDVYFEYDEAGVLSQILIGYSTTDLNARCTPSYDANGNMVSLLIKTNSGETTATYTYDDQNRLIQAIGPYTYSGEPQTITYTYDAAGQLVQMTKSWTDWFVYEEVTAYTYANGCLKEAVVTYTQTSEYSDPTTITSTYTYTCDAEGRPLTVSYTTDDPYYSYASQVRTYIYENLYVYTSEA